MKENCCILSLCASVYKCCKEINKYLYNNEADDLYTQMFKMLRK